MKYEEPDKPLPFENTSAYADTAWETEVKKQLGKLKGGLDGYYDTIDKHSREGKFDEEDAVDLCSQSIRQIEIACQNLTKLGINLPVSGEQYLGGERTEPNEDMYALAHWVYNFYDASFKWNHIA